MHRYKRVLDVDLKQVNAARASGICIYLDMCPHKTNQTFARYKWVLDGVLILVFAWVSQWALYLFRQASIYYASEESEDLF